MGKWSIAALAAVVLVGLVVIFVVVSMRAGDLRASLDRTKATIEEIKDDLKLVQQGRAEMDRTTRAAQQDLAQSRLRLSQVADQLDRPGRAGLISAYRLAEGNLTLSLTQLMVAAEIINNHLEVVRLSDANDEALRALLLRAPGQSEAAEFRRHTTDRLNRIKEFSELSDLFTNDLARLQNEQHQDWQTISDRFKNLKAMAGNDPRFEQGFQTMALLITLSGTAISNVGRLESVLRALALKEAAVRRGHEGLLAVAPTATSKVSATRATDPCEGTTPDTGPCRARAGGIDDAIAGRSALKLNRYDEAIRLFTGAIDSSQLSPRDVAGAHLGRGSAYAAKSLHQLAIADFTETLRILPDNSQAYYNRGTAYVYTQEYEMAERDLSKVIELTPDDQNAYVNRGTLYYLTQKYPSAIADFKQAIRLDGQDPIAYNKLGIAYIANGQWIWSCGQFKKAIELKPDYQDAIDNFRKQCPER